MIKFTKILFLILLLTNISLASDPGIDKESMAPPDATMETMVIERLENGYVAVDVDMDGDDGNYEEGADISGGSGYVKLTFSWPGDGWTQWMMFYVDGITSKTQYGSSLMPASDTQYVNWVDTTAVIQWDDWNGVMIRTEFHPVSLGATPGQIEQIKYKVVMKPVDGSSHNCGAMIFFDTMINANDGAPISTSYGYSGVAEIFYAPDIPSIWRAYEVGFPPGPGEIQALGILTGYEATMPDVFWYGYWSDGVGLGWATAAWAAATGGGFTDSATMVKWSERPIASDDSLVCVTYYGIGNFETMEVMVNHTPPIISPGCDGTMNPDTTHFNFMIINNGTAEICNAVATLEATGFNHLSTPNPLNIGTIAGYGGSYVVDWDVQFDPAIWGTYQEYIFTLSFDDCSGGDSTIVDTFEIYIPHPSDIEVNLTVDDSILCMGDTANLNASFSGTYGTANYTWSPSYGLSDPYALDPQAFPEVTTTYTFTVTDSNGCVGVAYITIVIDQIFAEAGSEANICAGDSIMIGGVPTASGGIPPFDYTWTPSVGLSDSTIANPYAKPDTTTMYYVEIVDANGCVAMDSVLISVSQAPYAYFIIPDSCGGITSCNPPEFELIVADPDSVVDPVMFGAYIDDVWFTYSDGVFDYSDTILTITPIGTFVHGETVLVELTQYRDFEGCAGEAVSCSVIVDAQPPLAIMTNPIPGGSIMDPSPTIQIQIQDEPAGIDTNSFEYISVYLNGTPVSGFSYSWSEPFLELSGFSFADGGTVMVCLDSLWDTPDYDYCPPNDTSSCWSFVVTTGDVNAFPVEPTDMQSTACDDQSLSIQLWGSVNPVEPATILLTVDGIPYTVDSSSLIYSDTDSMLTFDPGGTFWEDNDTICISLWAEDIYGGGMEDTMRYCFITDFSPPYIINAIPAEDETVTTLPPSFQFDILDEITGVDSILVTIDDSIVLGIDSACVDFDGTTFSFDAECAGIYYPPDEDVEICVNALDSPDLCTPNELDTCWTFVVSMICSLVADAGEDIDMCIGSSAILGGIPVATDGTPPFEYLWTLDDGSFVSDEGHPEVFPTEPTTYILTVTDSLGCVDSDTVFVNAHNCEGPTANIIRPEDGLWSSCDSEYIQIAINDSDGVVDTTIVIRVNTIEYTVDSVQVDWSEPILTFTPSTPFSDGDTVYVDLISAEDIHSNSLEGAPISWRFYIDYSPPSIWGEVPTAGSTISESFISFSLRLDDAGSGVDTSSILVSIGDYTFSYSDTCFHANPGPGEAFTIITIDSLCLPMNPCDTMLVNVLVTDTTDYCEDNVLDTSWILYTDCNPPSAEIIYPGESLWYSCVDDSVVVNVLDIEPGVDTLSLFISATDGAGYFESAGWGSPGFYYDVSSGLLVWHPATPFPDLGNIMITVNATDILGNSMDPLVWTLFMDRIPPTVLEFHPGCDSTIFTVVPDIYIIAADSGCGEITPTLSVDGLLYTDFEFIGDTIRLSPSIAPVFSGGDTVEFCWNLEDCAGDICIPNSIDTCCTFYVAAGGPVVVIHNPADSDYVACDSFSVYMTISDNDGIIPDSVQISVEIDGTPYILNLTSPEIDYTEFPDSITLQWTPSSITDGMEVTVSVISAYDSLYNSLSYSDEIAFIFDFSPPEFSNISPADDEIVEILTPTICADISDDGSGVDWSAVSITVNSIDYDTTNPAIDVDLGIGRICFNPAVLGTSWAGGDTIDVCISAADSPDTCGPNLNDTCWSFSIATGGPQVQVISPVESVIVACQPDSIIWIAADHNGIDWNQLEIVLWADDDSFYFTSESDEVYTEFLDGADSMAIYLEIPSGLADGTEIQTCLVTLPDSLGNPTDTTCIYFMVDYNEPDFDIISPADGDTVHSNQPLAIVELNDLGSGVNESMIVITVDGVEYYVDGTCLTYFEADDSLVFDPAECGIAWSGGSEVEICLYSEDFADSQFCGPNILDTCWHFWIAAEAPQVEIIRPMDSSVTSCSPDTIIIIIQDPDGVVDSSIAITVNGETLQLGDEGLLFTGDTLFYIPPVPFDDGEFIEVCLTEAEDNLGNAITEDVCVRFWVDYSAPELVQTIPANGVLVSDLAQDIVLTFFDYPAGVDTSTLELEINSDAISHNSIIWTFSGDTVHIRYIPENDSRVFAQGDTIIVDVYITDTTAYCADNIADTSFLFYTEPDVGCYIRPNPFTPNTDGYNDITVFDYPGMFSHSAEFIVFDIRGVEVYRAEIGPVENFQQIENRKWNGMDNENNPLPPGIYMYVITYRGELVCSGTVIIAR